MLSAIAGKYILQRSCIIPLLYIYQKYVIAKSSRSFKGSPVRIKRNKQKGPFLSRLPSLTINGENRSSQDAKREGALTATLNPIHNTIIMGCVRPFKEGIGFSHHTGVCSKGQTHNLIPSVLKRNRVQILYKKGLRFFQGFSPVGVWLFSL